jgi:putative ABC transport system substrate-binding protein
MNRIIFALLVAAIFSQACSVAAQSSGKVRRVGFVAPQSQPAGRVDAFRQGLRDLGYLEGQNLKFEYRGHEDRSRLAGLAAELAREKVDVIVTQGFATRAAQGVQTVPIIFGFSGDPVEAGLVKSLAHPGGNMTGITMLAFELVGKRLEALKEAVPRVTRVAVLSSPAHPGEQRELSESQKTARSIGMTLLYHQVNNTADVNAALDATHKEKAERHPRVSGPSNEFASRADRGICDQTPAPERLWMERIRRGRRVDILRPGP